MIRDPGHIETLRAQKLGGGNTEYGGIRWNTVVQGAKHGIREYGRGARNTGNTEYGKQYASGGEWLERAG
eukprot:1806069-Prymnesium_polylepis.1